jgi:hypothetical protein
MKILTGEVFSINTKIGFGFIQYVETNHLGMEIVRVLEPIKQERKISQDEINITERYSFQFVVKAAVRKKIIERIGIFQLPKEYRTPLRARTQHIVRGEFLGWHIVDQTTLKRELRKELTQEELLLSPHGSPNDTLLIQYLEDNWRLENWK